MYVRNLKHAQLEVSVIKLMSFNTLAISIKLRVRSKDAFNKKKNHFHLFRFLKNQFSKILRYLQLRGERGKNTHQKVQNAG